MTVGVSVDDFSEEVKCNYKDERYAARDNGAILRHPRAAGRGRSIDGLWSFGKINPKKGYYEIASVPVHRIIATAFHGVPPTEWHVVDHIDTNKQNNRPENLRWVTRLENILLNPITAKRIATACGSVEAFLEEPAKFRDTFLDPNFEWMGTVSKEEAQISLERMLSWAKSDQVPSGGSLGEWIYYRGIPYEPAEAVPQDVTISSKTLNAAQRNWKVPSEFPCCPQEYTGDPIAAYARELKEGLVFCTNEVYSSTVVKSAISEAGTSLFVLTESDNFTPWALAKITFENDLFVHSSIRSFHSIEGAEKQYCLAQGLEWTGGDSIDDYC